MHHFSVITSTCKRSFVELRVAGDDDPSSGGFKRESFVDLLMAISYMEPLCSAAETLNIAPERQTRIGCSLLKAARD